MRLTKTQKNWRKVMWKKGTDIYDTTRKENPFYNESGSVSEGNNGMAITSMILGIVGLILGLAPFIGWIFFPLWLLAILLGIIARFRSSGNGMATAGIVLGIITIVYKIWFFMSLTNAIPKVY